MKMAKEPASGILINPLILELFVNDGKFLTNGHFLTYFDLPRIW